MREAVEELRPVPEWNQDTALREQVLTTWTLAFARSPLEPAGLHEIPFTGAAHADEGPLVERSVAATIVHPADLTCFLPFKNLAK